MQIEGILLVLGIIVLTGALLLPIIISIMLDEAENIMNQYHRFKEKKEKYKKKKRKTKPFCENKIIFPLDYESTKSLKKTFFEGKENAIELINMIFPAPQLSNNKFVDEIEDISKKFIKIYDNLLRFHHHYPKEDEKSEKIIRQERKKLIRLNRRLENIVGELAILLLDNEDDVNIDEINEDIKNDTDDIRQYSNSRPDTIDEIIEQAPDKNIEDDKLDSTNLLLEKTGVLRDSFGRRTPVDCIDCLHSSRVDVDDNYVFCAKKKTIKPQVKLCNDFRMR